MTDEEILERQQTIVHDVLSRSGVSEEIIPHIIAELFTLLSELEEELQAVEEEQATLEFLHNFPPDGMFTA